MCGWILASDPATTHPAVEFEQVMAQADQAPLAFHLLLTSEQELPVSAAFDLPEDRFDDRFSSGVDPTSL